MHNVHSVSYLLISRKTQTRLCLTFHFSFFNETVDILPAAFLDNIEWKFCTLIKTSLYFALDNHIENKSVMVQFLIY